MAHFRSTHRRILHSNGMCAGTLLRQDIEMHASLDIKCVFYVFSIFNALESIHIMNN